MHPILFKIGTFEVGTYGLLLALGFFAALALAKRQAKIDALPPEGITDLAITVLIAGIVGSKLLMVLVDVIHGETMSQVFSVDTLRAGGAVHGGIIAGTLAFFWRVRKWKLQIPTTLDALVPAVALGQAIGRLGCLAAGCCYGSECHAPWAITFRSLDASRFSGTPLDVPLHPVQLYTFLANLAVMALLLVSRRSRRFKGQIGAAYFLLEGLSRLIVETWRGDLDRGIWFGLSWLSTGRLTALGFIAFGILLWICFARRKPAEESEAGKA